MLFSLPGGRLICCVWNYCGYCEEFHRQNSALDNVTNQKNTYKTDKATDIPVNPNKETELISFTIQRSGIYIISAHFEEMTVVKGYKLMNVTGSSLGWIAYASIGNGSSINRMGDTAIVSVPAGEKISLYVQHDHTSALTFRAALSLIKISDKS